MDVSLIAIGGLTGVVTLSFLQLTIKPINNRKPAQMT